VFLPFIGVRMTFVGSTAHVVLQHRPHVGVSKLTLELVGHTFQA
jgi:hypothetical protein